MPGSSSVGAMIDEDRVPGCIHLSATKAQPTTKTITAKASGEQPDLAINPVRQSGATSWGGSLAMGGDAKAEALPRRATSTFAPYASRVLQEQRPTRDRYVGDCRCTAVPLAHGAPSPQRFESPILCRLDQRKRERPACAGLAVSFSGLSFGLNCRLR